MQLGTAFAVTQECDAPQAFKEILAHAKPEDLQEFISVAGLPARAVKTPWLDKYIRIESKLQDRAHVKKSATCRLTACNTVDCVMVIPRWDSFASISNSGTPSQAMFKRVCF